MKLIEKLADPAEWEIYLKFKQDKNHLSKQEEEDLIRFIDECRYVPVVERIQRGEGLSLPSKKMIRKTGTEKKRVVYMYPEDENRVLKLMTFLLLRKYDGIFSNNLYSFRINSGVRKAVYDVLKQPELDEKYTYKTDISNYFNSIDIDRMVMILRERLIDDPELAELLEALLREKRVIYEGREIEEEKGVMAGTPFAVFLANLYLEDLDREVMERGIVYARYSDDIIMFSDSREEAVRNRQFIHEYLNSRGLRINPDKEVLTAGHEPWSFLGIKYCNGEVDISDNSKAKLKAKIRRRARSIRRWQVRKNIPEDKAVRAFIKAMNRKFYTNGAGEETNWSRWYFPIINTDRTLHEIDLYVQYWARFLMTGKHINKNYELKYETLKEYGYRSLVHEWYEYTDK